MKKILLITILIFLSNNSYCQKKEVVFADENCDLISREEFDRKISSDLFLTASFENDTVVINKLRFTEYYGDLGRKKNHN